ncbi:MAG: cytochrome c3 family protein [Pseudomonadota bacterium]
MRFLIRYKEVRGTNRVSHEVEIEGSVATIGRGTDQAIKIADRHVALHHGTLSVNRSRLTLRMESGATFTQGDEVHRQNELKPGDSVLMGTHELRYLEHTDEDTYVLELSIDDATLDRFSERYHTSLIDVEFPVRKLSWSFFFVLLVMGLALPVASFFQEDSIIPEVLTDVVWRTGDLHHTHAFMGDDCGYCHKRPFEQVQNSYCIACHVSTHHHVGEPDLSESAQRCGDCHREHNEEASLIRQDATVCVDCHRHELTPAGQTSAARTIPAVHDFMDAHPGFQVSVQHLVKSGWVKHRGKPGTDIVDGSNLRFPHDVHLSPEGINSPTGRRDLTCAQCHVPETGGQGMKTPNMTEHCSGCHELTFDPDFPHRVVPHGSPSELMQLLREYYAFQFLNGEMSDAGPDFERPVRRPGVTGERLISRLVTRDEQTAALSEEASDYIEHRVEEAALNLFERQICTTCHDVHKIDGPVPYEVTPVRLTSEWMPAARFDHRTHRTMDCADCHSALASPVAEDVLMPTIDTCRTCHGGVDATDRLSSTCVTCHGFHLDDKPMMGMPGQRSGDVFRRPSVTLP